MAFTPNPQPLIATDEVDLPDIINGDTWLGGTVDIKYVNGDPVDITDAKIEMSVYKDGEFAVRTWPTITTLNNLITITNATNGECVIGPAQILIPDDLTGECRYVVSIEVGHSPGSNGIHRTVMRGAWVISRSVAENGF